MANRSKKVVLSVRVEPYLKDALDVLARLKNRKIVETLEILIQEAADGIFVENPFWESRVEKKYADERITLNRLMSLVWSNDPIIYRLRLAQLGSDYLDEPGFLACSEVWENNYFLGEDDIFEYTRQAVDCPDALRVRKLNLELVKEEWDKLNGYAEFLLNNRPLVVSYSQYKEMLPREDSLGDGQADAYRYGGGGSFRLKKRADGKYQFDLVASNGEVVLISDTYSNKESALHGVESVRINARRDGAFEVREAAGKNGYLLLKALNGQILGKVHISSLGALEDQKENLRKLVEGAEFQ